MRPHFVLAFLLAACSQQPAGEILKPGTYFGAGRDALCIIGSEAPQRFAFVAFAAKGDTNCAAEGRAEKQSDGWKLIPAGEKDCRIPIEIDGNALSFGPVPAACSYYCGPAASFAGQRFQWTDTSDKLLVENPLAHGGVC
jgi:hypothetical protein